MSASLVRTNFWGVVACVAYFIAAVAALHMLHPERHPVEHPMSMYARTEHAALMNSALFAWGLGLCGTAIAAFRVLRRTPVIASCCSLTLVVSAVGIWMAGWYVTDELDAVPTKSGKLHILGAMMCFIPMFFLPTIVGLKGTSPSKWHLVLAVFVASFNVLFFTFVYSGYGGVFQRLAVLTYFAWMALTCWDAWMTAEESALT